MIEDTLTAEDWVEIEGRSKGDAIERACNALNTTPAYMEYEVIGNKGAKIRARKLTEARTDVEIAASNSSEVIEEVEEEPPQRVGLSVAPSEERAPRIREREEEKPEEFLAEPTELGNKAKEYLTEVLRHIDDATNVTLQETTSEIRLEIQGNGSGLFIGKHGQTLEALQHVVAKMCGLDRSKSEKRITVDSERYRARRQESLEGLARKLAARARRERRPISVEPMSAIDRRVLHMALQDDRSVSTKSVGEGAGRKVVIVPRNVGGEGRRGGGGGNDSRRGGGGFRQGSGNNGRRGGGGGPGRTAPQRSRPRPTGARMHDSFDVPPAPEHDLFENDDDLLAHGMNMQEGDEEAQTESNENTDKE